MDISGASNSREPFRNRGYYNREGYFGFKYRRVKDEGEGEKDGERDLERVREKHPEDNERRKDESKLGAVGVADKTIEEDEDLDNEEEESDENNEDVLYELETMKLVNSIKKLLALKGGGSMDEEKILQVLAKFDKIRQFITSPSELRLRPLQPHPHEAEIRHGIATSRARSAWYRQKHEEDKRLVDSHCVMAGLTLQTSTEAETQLPQGSVIQRPIANEPSAADHEAAEKDSERLRLLDSVAQVCSARLKEYEQNLLLVQQQHKRELTSTTSNDETPRTIFKAFKAQN